MKMRTLPALMIAALVFTAAGCQQNASSANGPMPSTDPFVGSFGQKGRGALELRREGDTYVGRVAGDTIVPVSGRLKSGTNNTLLLVADFGDGKPGERYTVKPTRDGVDLIPDGPNYAPLQLKRYSNWEETLKAVMIPAP